MEEGLKNLPLCRNVNHPFTSEHLAMKRLITLLLLLAAAAPIVRAEPASKIIATVVERGSTVYAYNDKGTIIATLNRGSGPKDGLVGYTQSTISVRRGSTVYVYNPNGSIISTVNAR
jgi:hypothetical protein